MLRERFRNGKAVGFVECSANTAEWRDVYKYVWD